MKILLMNLSSSLIIFLEQKWHFLIILNNHFRLRIHNGNTYAGKITEAELTQPLVGILGLSHPGCVVSGGLQSPGNLSICICKMGIGFSILSTYKKD